MNRLIALARVLAPSKYVFAIIGGVAAAQLHGQLTALARADAEETVQAEVAELRDRMAAAEAAAAHMAEERAA